MPQQRYTLMMRLTFSLSLPPLLKIRTLTASLSFFCDRKKKKTIHVPHGIITSMRVSVNRCLSHVSICLVTVPRVSTIGWINLKYVSGEHHFTPYVGTNCESIIYEWSPICLNLIDLWYSYDTCLDLILPSIDLVWKRKTKRWSGPSG